VQTGVPLFVLWAITDGYYGSYNRIRSN
jgi:hypothetical protein